MDMQQTNYKFMVGCPHTDITHGNKETCPAGLNKDDFAERRQAYFDLQKGLAGMIYYHAAKDYALEDRQWIEHLKPKSAKREISRIESGDAFRSMIDEIYDQARKYEYYTSGKYFNYKAFLDNKLGNQALDQFGAPMTEIPKFSSLDNKPQAELRTRLDALIQERAELFRSAQLNPNAYENMPESHRPQRLADKERIVCLKDLRTSIRDGNTTGLFNRYLQHQRRINQKNAQQELQAQNNELNRNNEAQQSKQAPEAGGAQMV
jgi:hypothetical protein